MTNAQNMDTSLKVVSTMGLSKVIMMGVGETPPDRVNMVNNDQICQHMKFIFLLGTNPTSKTNQPKLLDTRKFNLLHQL